MALVAQGRQGIEAVQVPLAAGRVAPVVDLKPVRAVAQAAGAAIALKSLLAKPLPCRRSDVALVGQAGDPARSATNDPISASTERKPKADRSSEPP